MRILTVAALALATASCGAPAPTDQAQPADQVNEATARESGARIAALPEGQRDAVFIRAIRDAGLDCQEVTGSTPAEPYRGMPVWAATCRGGGQWTLVIGADETVQILNANEARLVRGEPVNAQ